ncbi:hypothetical protein JTF06_05100 [Desemzia sp. RIT804]|uniref:hypothetical protein n=1 Tax=Desemzia sp. RIT 804 TaxID=2810209 RepID=UPI00194DD772|nr:hypothetical protein [Desemzia sp. RIT 804]MBM6614264.1 hypothetical protein [Desemzia sp. RIT 804]
MNKRLGKWQIIVGSLIVLMGIFALIIQPLVAVFVIAYGVYIVYVGFKIKKGNHPFQKNKDNN